MTQRLRILLVLTLPFLVLRAAAEPSANDITWDDLLPKEVASFDDPFEKLSEEQLLDLGMVARIRYLLESEKIAPDGADAAEEKQLVEKLSGQGIDVDWLLNQRERVAEMRQRRAEQVDEGVDGQRIRIPGYMLPLARDDDGRVSEFLLVPWVGACIHTPPPPPNQMIHVDVPGGAEDRGRFAPIWLQGLVQLEPGAYDLFLVDGTRSINVAYTMTSNGIEDYSAQQSDVLAKVEAPAANPEHSWWQNLQTRISILFTKTMTAIRDRESSGPLWIGLLVAFGYGVVHTLGPGHGKAVVVSYFVGHGGSFGRGVRMGVQIAVFHVLSAILVVWITDFAVRQATGNAPSDYRLVKLISYTAIAVIGAFMLAGAIRGARLRHDHDIDHDRGDDANSDAGDEAAPTPAITPSERKAYREAHSKAHANYHDSAEHVEENYGGILKEKFSFESISEFVRRRRAEFGTPSEKKKADPHHHDGCHACEAVAKAEAKGPAGWLALAVGSVPCTGALLVLLFGMANNLLGPAILMVIAISAGMALAMSGIGVVAILGRDFVDRRLEGDAARQHRFANGARIAGASVVLLIGLGLFSLTLFSPRPSLQPESKPVSTTAETSDAS